MLFNMSLDGYLRFCFVFAVAVISPGIVCQGTISASRKYYPEVPPAKTIQSEDGDLIDCVDVYSQPSLAHPLLQNHKIQVKPNEVNTDELSEVKHPWRSTGGCPKGTVPILRKSPDYDPPKVTPLLPFGRRQYHTSFHFDGGQGYEYGLVRGDYGRDFVVHGAVGDFTIWNPKVEMPEKEFSAVRVQVVSGDIEGSPSEAISAGWMVHPGLFNDTRSRLFASFHSFSNGGCFNVLCNGFVQVDSTIPLGVGFTPSEAGWFQKDISVQISKIDDKWWLKVFEKNVGYWPAGMFKYLSQHANSTNYGGEIFNSKPAGGRTKTEMGNGVVPNYRMNNFDRTACFKNWDYIDDRGERKSIRKYERNSQFVTRGDCYALDVKISQDGFCFGGPAQDDKCRG